VTACEDRTLQLQALIDGELDAANSLAMEAHIAGCAGCAEELARLEAMRASLRAPGLAYAAPSDLRERIDWALAAETAPARPDRARPRRNQPWLSALAGAAVAASLTLLIAAPQLATVRLEDQLVSSHVRSLLADHLTDVATSNEHVVKPWFNGKIDFAPPVVELADQGFPLAGGRLDYVGGAVTPAIVYHRRLHTINLFVRRAGAFSSLTGVMSRRDGYSLVRWTQGGMEFWAVSDISPADLESFHRAFAGSIAAPQR